MTYEIDLLLDDEVSLYDELSKFISPVNPGFKEKDKHFAAFLIKVWPEWLAKLETKISQSEGPYLLGKSVTLADLVISANFFKLSHDDTYENCHILESVIDQYPKVKAWIGKLHAQFASYLKA